MFTLYHRECSDLQGDIEGLSGLERMWLEHQSMCLEFDDYKVIDLDVNKLNIISSNIDYCWTLKMAATY